MQTMSHKRTRNRRRLALCWGPLLAALTACAEGSNLPPLPDTHSAAYHLGVGDQVRVLTFGEEQLTGEFRINDSGNIALPLVGALPASGRTTGELSAEIADELRSKKLMREPSVSVEVMNYRPIFVLGEVSHPGQYPYQPGMTVLTAVTVAGGFTYRAIKSYGSILRTTNGKAVEGRVSRQTYVEPGDVITIYERHF